MSAAGLAPSGARALATYSSTFVLPCEAALECEGGTGEAAIAITLDETAPDDLGQWSFTLTYIWTGLGPEAYGPQTLTADADPTVLNADVDLAIDADSLTITPRGPTGSLFLRARMTSGPAPLTHLYWAFLAGDSKGGYRSIATTGDADAPQIDIFDDEAYAGPATFSASAVPLPGALPLAAAGLGALGGLGALSRRRGRG